MDLIKELESQQLKKEMPVINVGDTVRVHVKIKEGSRERIPALIGAAVARHLPEIAPDFVRVRRKEVYDAEMNVFR